MDAVDDFAAINLVAGGVGVFPGIKRPRVIWVGLGGQIQSAFRNAARAGGQPGGPGF